MRERWCERRESNAHLQVGSLRSYQLDDASTFTIFNCQRMAIVAGVEPAGHGFGDRTSAITSRPFNRSGVTDRIRTGYYLVHSQTLFQSSLGHTATIEFGANDRHRTCNILLTKQALFQLSYIGVTSSDRGSTSPWLCMHQFVCAALCL